MAKNLVFQIKGKNYEAAPVKVDRKKLYGWSETKALDDKGNQIPPRLQVFRPSLPGTGGKNAQIIGH